MKSIGLHCITPTDEVIRAIVDTDCIWTNPNLFVCGFQNLGLAGSGAYTNAVWKQTRVKLRNDLDATMHDKT